MLYCVLDPERFLFLLAINFYPYNFFFNVSKMVTFMSSITMAVEVQLLIWRNYWKVHTCEDQRTEIDTVYSRFTEHCTAIYNCIVISYLWFIECFCWLSGVSCQFVKDVWITDNFNTNVVFSLYYQTVLSLVHVNL